jgi:pimeloyl-ACP methyl ester carboxylesterase
MTADSTATQTGRRVDVLGIELSVLTGGSGPAVLVVHRDTGRGGWTAFHERLASRCSVYAPALPGFDDSTRPHWLRTPAETATILGFALDKLGVTPVAAVGLGFGGWVVAEAAVQSPSRFSKIVLHSPMGVQPERGEIIDQFLWTGVEYVQMGFADPARFEALFGDASDETLQRAWDWNRDMTTRIAWKPYMFSQALPRLLPALHLPTLIVHSAEDRIVPRSCSERYATLIRGAELVDLPGVGHQADLEAPDALAARVEEFLG